MFNGDEERNEGWRWKSAFNIRWFIPQFLYLSTTDILDCVSVCCRAILTTEGCSVASLAFAHY